MRTAALALCGLTILAACERQATDTPVENAAPVEAVGVSASDALSGLTAPATGIAFWVHPNVAFNSVIIVASSDGVTSYNIEDGSEVSRIPGVAAEGAAVSYFGFGPQATGILAYFDADKNGFSFHSIDNNSRLFTAMDGGPEIHGAVRGYCFGRAQDVGEPSLFVVQKSKVIAFNLALTEAGPGSKTVTITSQTTIDTPGNLTGCAVDTDGVLLAATSGGDIYRLDGDNSFDAAFATSAITGAGNLIIVATNAPEQSEPARYGQILLLDRSNGAVHMFDREDGHALGAVTISATDELTAVTSAATMGAAGANLGGLYRNGVIALGVDGESPSIKLIPLNGALNVLSVTAGAPVNPRGEAPVVEDNSLIIDVTFSPE